MIAYLDTNAVILLTQGRKRHIGRDAARFIERSELRVSPMVVVELQLLYEIGRIGQSARDIRRKLEHEIGLRVCDLPFAEVANAALDETWTRDPFDRMIVGQAKANGLAPLISADEKIAMNYTRTVW